MRHPHLKGQAQSLLPLELLGKEIKVWWNTGKVNEVGENIGKILGVKEYTGRYDFYNCVLEINAPNLQAGKLEMAYHTRFFKDDQR